MKEERLTEQTPGEIAAAPTPQNQPSKCFMVIDSSYDVGLNVYAFWSHEDAGKSVREDAQTVMTDLEEQGYERIEVLEEIDSTTIYVPDTDIYYEWEICESEIR